MTQVTCLNLRVRVYIYTERLEIFEETAEENWSRCKRKCAAIIANAIKKDALFLESEPVRRNLQNFLLIKSLNNNYGK